MMYTKTAKKITYTKKHENSDRFSNHIQIKKGIREHDLISLLIQKDFHRTSQVLSPYFDTIGVSVISLY
jgi:hypothetical protein